MTSIVTDFKSIRQKLERQEQKAEFEANNPKEEASNSYGMGWPYGAVATPLPGGYDEKTRMTVTAWGALVITHPEHEPLYWDGKYWLRSSGLTSVKI
jgi:hypothetical protein